MQIFNRYHEQIHLHGEYKTLKLVFNNFFMRVLNIFPGLFNCLDIKQVKTVVTWNY